MEETALGAMWWIRDSILLRAASGGLSLAVCDVQLISKATMSAALMPEKNVNDSDTV